MSKGVSAVSMICGLLLLVAGVSLVVLGASARSEVIRGMAEDEVTTEIDGEQRPVTTAKAAMNQYNLIKEHTLGSFGSYASMERDDPRRDVYLKGLTLRNSLVIGRMGLQVSLLITGLGVLFALTGLPLTLRVSAVRANNLPDSCARRERTGYRHCSVSGHFWKKHVGP